MPYRVIDIAVAGRYPMHDEDHTKNIENTLNAQEAAGYLLERVVESHEWRGTHSWTTSPLLVFYKEA